MAVHPGASGPPPALKSGHRAPFDLLDHLGAFLRSSPRQTLVITGEAGSGKSTLLRTLVPLVPGKGVFVGYRTVRSSEPGGARGAGSSPPVSLLLLEPGTPGAAPSPETSRGAEQSLSFATAALQEEEDPAQPMTDAIARVAAGGEGFLAVDSWDAESEQEFRALAGPTASGRVLTGTGATLRAQLGNLPIRGIFAVLPDPTPDPELLSAAEGVLVLGWEEVEGHRLRVVSIPKLRRTPPPETRYLYTLEGGSFVCPPQFPAGFRPPIGPPDPDPDPEEPSLFPGSLAFADAFGRLRYRGLTGMQLPPRFPSNVADVFLFPLVAHAISVGGRVAWIPSPSTGPAEITEPLAHIVPPDSVRGNLRVLSSGTNQPGLGDLQPVAVPVRQEMAPDPSVPVSPPVPAAPLFPELLKFLRGAPEGRPTVVVIHLDGLHALAAAAGETVNAQTFPLIVGTYMRLPTFHGFGFGRTDDPLTKVLTAGVDTDIQIEERYGRTVLWGVRPRTNPYILDWREPNGRYTLLPVR